MLVNRHRQKRITGDCQYCQDPRTQPLDADGRCSACQGQAHIFISNVDESAPDSVDKGGRPMELETSISIPKLLDPDLGLSRAQRLALILDTSCSPIISKPSALPIYSLRLRPLVSEWLRLNILSSNSPMEQRHQYSTAPPRPPYAKTNVLELGQWSTYQFTRTMDIYVLSRLLAVHAMELRSHARQVVFYLHTKCGPLQEWDRALGLHPFDDITSLVFPWPTFTAITLGLYGMPVSAPQPSIAHYYPRYIGQEEE